MLVRCGRVRRTARPSRHSTASESPTWASSSLQCSTHCPFISHLLHSYLIILPSIPSILGHFPLRFRDRCAKHLKQLNFFVNPRESHIAAQLSFYQLSNRHSQTGFHILLFLILIRFLAVGFLAFGFWIFPTGSASCASAMHSAE